MGDFGMFLFLEEIATATIISNQFVKMLKRFLVQKFFTFLLILNWIPLYVHLKTFVTCFQIFFQQNDIG